MESPPNQDPIDREVRGLMLAKRLLRLEVRTDMITKFTGVPRNRLAALRRRLDVAPDARPRGHARSRIETFIANAERRFESSSLAALLALFGLIAPEGGPAITRRDRLDVGEGLCEIYQYVRKFFPDVDIDFEDLVRLRTTLVRRELLEIGRCRQCGVPVVVERNDHRHRICAFCESEEKRFVAGNEYWSALPSASSG